MAGRMNEIFKEYENIHKGEEAVLVAGGPSLEKFVPLEDVIYAGVNHIGKHRLFDQSVPGSIKLDYYFFGDRNRYMPKDFKVLRQKFGACILNGREHPGHLTKKEVESLGGKAFEQTNQRHGIKRNERGSNSMFDCVVKSFLSRRYGHGFPEDISKSPCYGNSVVTPVMQFLLYTGVSKIYLVGADCAGGPSFGIKGPDFYGNKREYKRVIPDWNDFKVYLNEVKPDVRIISINPVGLKGYFEDIYY